MNQQKAFVREQKNLLKSTYLILGIGLLLGFLAVTLAAELALRFDWVFPGDGQGFATALLGFVGLLAIDLAYMSQMRQMRDRIVTTVRRTLPETKELDRGIVRDGLTTLRCYLAFHTLVFVGLLWAAMWLACSAAGPHQAWRGLMSMVLLYLLVLYALHGIVTVSGARLLQEVRPDYGPDTLGSSKKR